MPRSWAKCLALPGLGEATASSSMSGTMRAAAAWRSATNPVPISPTLTLLIAKPPGEESWAPAAQGPPSCFVHVPDDDVVSATRGGPHAVGGEGNGVDLADLPVEAAALAAGGHVPQLDRAVV